MRSKPMGFFPSLKSQTINGAKLSRKVFALDLIEKIKQSDELTKTMYTDDLRRLKDMALCGDEDALEFYLDTIELCPLDSTEVAFPHLIDQILLDIVQIGFKLKNPELLYKAFYLKTMYSRFPNLANTCEAFECLKAAAQMRGEYAVKASYHLAFIYGEASDFTKSYVNFKQFSYLYAQIIWLNDEKSLQEEIALAELGCPSAINRLSADEARWAEAKKNNPEFLKAQFDFYFNLSLNNTLRNDYTQLDKQFWNFQEHKYEHEVIDIACLIGMYGKRWQIQNSDFLFTQFRELFTTEAVERNNCHAAFILAVGVCDGISLKDYGISSYKSLGLYEGHLPRNTNQATCWFQHILDIDNTPTAPLAKHAARALYSLSLSTDKSAAQRKKLLIQSHNLGDERSTYQLGALELANGNIEEAITCFDKVMARVGFYTPDICELLLKDNMRNNITLINYFYSICIEGIEQASFYYFIEKLVKQTGDIALLAKCNTTMIGDWNAESKQTMTDIINVLKDMSIEKMTEDMIANSGSRCWIM